MTKKEKKIETKIPSSVELRCNNAAELTLRPQTFTKVMLRSNHRIVVNYPKPGTFLSIALLQGTVTLRLTVRYQIFSET